MDAPNELIFHDFVSFIILKVPLTPFFRKEFENFEKLKKKKFYVPTPKGPPFGKKFEKLKEN